MTTSFGEAIEAHLGDCIMVDSDENGLCLRKFVSVHVRLDIRRPLRRGMKLDLNDLDNVWVDFQYEKLPDFCFRCGLLGHTLKNYVTEDEGSGDQCGASELSN